MSPMKSIIPDLTEPILVYRHWKIHGPTNLLVAPMHNDYPWGPGENIARCELAGKDIPACVRRDCRCGFYGVYTSTHSYADVKSLYHSWGGGQIFGVMAAYGRVSLGDHGLRCQKAKIIALHLPWASRFSGNRRIMNTLMSYYPDVRFYRHRHNLINREGVQRPDNLLKNIPYHERGMTYG